MEEPRVELVRSAGAKGRKHRSVFCQTGSLCEVPIRQSARKKKTRTLTSSLEGASEMPSAAGEASTLAEYQTLLAYDDRLAAFVVKAVNTSKEAKRKAAIQRALALFVCVLLFGAYYFANECQWEWYTGLYFSWITLSTIGLGDYSAMNRCPGNSYGDIARPAVLRVWLVYVCLGVVSISYVLATFADYAPVPPSTANSNTKPKKRCLCCQVEPGNCCFKYVDQCKFWFFLFVVFVVGAILFAISEGWSYADSFYFAITTLTTIGYGDYGAFYTAVSADVNLTESECLRYGDCSFSGITSINATCSDCVLSPCAKLTVIVYSLFGLAILGNIIGDLVKKFKGFRHVLERRFLVCCLKSARRAQTSSSAALTNPGSNEGEGVDNDDTPSADDIAGEMIQREYCLCDHLFWIRVLLLGFFGGVFLVAMIVFGSVTAAFQNNGLTAENDPNEFWDTADAMYFAVVTATTIGYGDLVPTVPGARLWLIFTALPMLGFVAFFVEHWVDTFQLIEGSIRKAFAARPNQGQHEDGKKCCAQPSASTACFELSLFLFAVVMVLLVNVTFVSALLVDMSLSPSTPTGAGSGSQHDLLSILYFVTYTYTTIGYGDQPTMPPLVRNYTSWTAVVNLAVYAYFFVFVAKSLEKVIQRPAAIISADGDEESESQAVVSSAATGENRSVEMSNVEGTNVHGDANVGSEFV